MSEVWTVVEGQDGRLTRPSLEALGAARELANRWGSRVVAVCPEGLPPEAAQHADLVLAAPEGERCEEAIGALLWELLRDRTPPRAILAPASARLRSAMAWLGAKLGVGVTSACSSLEVEGELLIRTRPVLGGRKLARTRVPGRPQLVTLRPRCFPPSGGGAAAPIERVDPRPSLRSRLVERRVEARAVDLTQAEVIVAGGRGVGGPEGFGLLEELARELGGVVAASRAAVDLGWAPPERQVGLSGKTVSPRLYVACGISGAEQHLAGMRTSEVVVAINRDPRAPIFSEATFGIVGDLFEVVPNLIRALRQRRGE